MWSLVICAYRKYNQVPPNHSVVLRCFGNLVRKRISYISCSCSCCDSIRVSHVDAVLEGPRRLALFRFCGLPVGSTQSSEGAALPPGLISWYGVRVKYSPSGGLGGAVQSQRIPASVSCLHILL